MDGQNSTKFCIHMIIDKIYIDIVERLFWQVFNRVTALNWCQKLVFAQYLENGWTEFNQILYTLYHWHDLCLFCKLSFFTNLQPLTSLMEIKGFLQCIAANKQQWCGLVAAASCGIVAACEFFVCKLVLLLLIAATLRFLFAATLQLLVAATLQLLVAATLQLYSCSNLAALSCSNLAALYVQRVCRPSCRLFLMGGVWT